MMMISATSPLTTDHPTYTQMAQAIAFMRQHQSQQPELAAIAQHVHLSPTHFQRLFTQWAGVSPKRFLQYLTVEYAKAKIAESQNLFDLTLTVGLSSPGRLHDLFVTIEAMTPGEFKSGGRNLTIQYGIHDTPFGRGLIATTPRGICQLEFLDPSQNELPTEAEERLRCAWPQADIRLDPAQTQGLCDRIFHPGGESELGDLSDRAPLTVHIKGTNFQLQVWRALLQLPIGGLTTYQGLATAMGRPTAARAVGNALGHNPIGYLIPCHRVIRGSGELGGYRWGVERKTALLGWEAAVSENSNSPHRMRPNSL